MNKYNPNIHHRRSIRLKGYDYSQAGLYFVTICCKDRECLYGEIVGEDLRVCSDDESQIILNDAGKMVEKWYYELENKFFNVKCHEMVVMPNHFHCIVEIVGADLRVCPDDISNANGMVNTNNNEGEHIGSPLHWMVQWFKTMTTNEYIHGVKTLGWKPFNGKLWQRNYYEHIIRNEQSYQRISEYMMNNPKKWQDDTFYT